MDAKELFMNGEFVPAEQGVVPVRAHGFAYGTGCFEGIRGYWNEEHRQVYLFRLREHYERLLRSCKILQIKLPYSVDDLVEISIELVKRNNQHQNVYLRPVAYKGDETLGVRLHGLKDHFLITSEPVGDYVDTHGLRACVSYWRRIDDNAIPARAKIIGSYVNSAFAKSEAMLNGFDEAIMLTHDGHVSEGSGENIFIIREGTLITPPSSDNILVGITRNTVIELAQKELGLPVVERQIDRSELYTADEVFMTGTAAHVTPIVKIDHRPVNDGAIGPLTRKIQTLYFEVAKGNVERYRHWCTPVHIRATTGSRS